MFAMPSDCKVETLDTKWFWKCRERGSYYKSWSGLHTCFMRWLCSTCLPSERRHMRVGGTKYSPHVHIIVIVECDIENVAIFFSGMLIKRLGPQWEQIKYNVRYSRTAHIFLRLISTCNFSAWCSPISATHFKCLSLWKNEVSRRWTWNLRIV